MLQTINANNQLLMKLFHFLTMILQQLKNTYLLTHSISHSHLVVKRAEQYLKVVG